MWAYKGTFYGESDPISTKVDKSPKLMTTYLLRGTRLRNSQADAEDSVGTQFGLVLGSVLLVQEFVDLCLVRHIESFLDEGRAKSLIDICDGFEDSFPVPFGFVAIPQLTCFVLPCSNVSPLVLFIFRFFAFLCWLHLARCFCGDRCCRPGPLPQWDCLGCRRRSVRGSSGSPC